jgi:hypothetical protein
LLAFQLRRRALAAVVCGELLDVVEGASGKWDQIGIPCKWRRGTEGLDKIYGNILITFAEGRVNFEVADPYSSIFPKTVPEDAIFCMLLTDKDGRINKADHFEGHFSQLINHVETIPNRCFVLSGAQPICPKVFEGFDDDANYYSDGFSENPHFQLAKWFLQLLFAILPLWWLGRFALRWSERKGGHSA